MTLAPLRSIAEPDYPDSDGKPMAESDQARKGLTYAVEALDAHFAARPDVYVSGNSFIYYARGFSDAVVSPDVYVVFGVEKRDRQSYKVWDEGGVTPDFVIEITSESTRYTDCIEKRNKYAQLGVTEYFQYDPTGNYLDPPLLGFRLIAGEYEPIDPGGNGSGAIAIRSEVLGLDLRRDRGQLRFYVPETGQKLLSYSEAIENLYNGAERLRATGMPLEQIATILNLNADDLRQRFGD